MSDELKEQAWSELCAMIGQSPSYSAKAFRAAFDFAWNRRADLAAPAEPAGQHDADSNAPWLSLAHSICADAGIAPGNITDRLNQLRERIEPAGQKWESLGIAGDAKRIVAANIKDELVVSVLFDLIDRLATPVMQEPAARVVTIAQGKNTGKQVQMLRDLPSGAELYAAPVPAIPPDTSMVEKLQAALRSVNAVAIERGDKFGACDQIDNDGQPYQSQWLADLLAAAPASPAVPQDVKNAYMRGLQDARKAANSADNLNISDAKAEGIARAVGMIDELIDDAQKDAGRKIGNGTDDR